MNYPAKIQLINGFSEIQVKSATFTINKKI